eukprot:Seg261.3 transcript_id=Seg261.3/GoldUCD/mRNA.D3Y31 product="hypothetical protein" protein_id=Seg261.3/GoldUCD/D3Y31
MELTKMFWEEIGYTDIGKTAQKEELDNHFKEIQEKVKQKYSHVKTIPGDLSKRDLNTYAKKKPTRKELNDLQGIIMELEMHSQLKSQWNTCGMLTVQCMQRFMNGSYQQARNKVGITTTATGESKGKPGKSE